MAINSVDAQRSLIQLQGLTVECSRCHPEGVRVPDYYNCPLCHGECTMPKYPSLQAEQHMIGVMTVERCDLNDLLMDAAKHKVWVDITSLFSGQFSVAVLNDKNRYDTDCIAAIPIEAALVALGKAERGTE